MGTPSPLLPEDLLVPRAPDADPQRVDQLRAEVRQLVDRIREVRPAEGSDDERDALLAFANLGWPQEAQLLAVSEWTDRIVRSELAEADTERKLALRHMERAIHVYGAVMESLAVGLRELSASELATMAQIAAGDVELTAEARVFRSFQLALIASLDSMSAPVEELSYWAFRTIRGASRVEALALQPEPVLALRAELARDSARNAWRDWTKADVDEELAPWPSSSP